jgi:hypothetical protein
MHTVQWQSAVIQQSVVSERRFPCQRSTFSENRLALLSLELAATILQDRHSVPSHPEDRRQSAGLVGDSLGVHC